MTWMVETDCCRQRAFADCSCPPDVPLYRGAHLDDCAMADFGANVTCDGSSPACCTQEHSHDEAANTCPGGHGVCTLAKCAVITPAGEPCPGGHCGKGIDGCTVCRPVTIVALPGSMPVTHFAGGA